MINNTLGISPFKVNVGAGKYADELIDFGIIKPVIGELINNIPEDHD